LLVVHRWTSAAWRLPCTAVVFDLACADCSERHDGRRYSAHQHSSTGGGLEAWGKAVCSPHCLTGRISDLPCPTRRYGSADRPRTADSQWHYSTAGRCATEYQCYPPVYVRDDAGHAVVLRDHRASQ